MFNPNAYENSRPDGFGVLEVVPDAKSGKEQTRLFVPLRRTELKGEVHGPLAGFRLVQTFGYRREDCDRVLEALYRFPLPGDAAVTGVRVRFGEVEIRADLKERQRAETDYEEARKQGRQAALLTRESPDVFTLQVAGLQPDQEVTVETAYVQLARAEGAGWSLRIPLTTSPRFVRADEAAGRHAHGQPLCLLRDPGHRFALDVTLRGAGAVESPTHRLDVKREGERLRIRLHDGEVLPDRDCVLSWRPAQEKDRPALQVLLHDDHATGQVYFLALVAPPSVRDRGRGVPREVVLLVDHSGSMQGPKWQAADWAVERFLSELTERDAFALGVFHDRPTWLGKAPRPADASEVGKAVAFLKEHRDTGGTELGVALEQALDQKRSSGDPARHVLIITDAEVSDAGRILRLADREAKQPDRRRISVLCIDAAPNAQLANELAERGGGLARFLTSQPDQEDITTALDGVLADWAEPVLKGLRLEVNRPQAEAAGRDRTAGSKAGWSAIDLGDLPAGRPVWVAGRVPHGDVKDLTFRVTAGNKWELAASKLDLAREADGRSALKALFGARRVRGLEYLMHSGSTGKELTDQLEHLGFDWHRVQIGKAGKVYHENAQKDVGEALRELLVREALDCGLASSETAFVAVRTEAGKPVEGTVAVANALPAGWSEDFLRVGYGGAVVSCLMAPTVGALDPADLSLHACYGSSVGATPSLPKGAGGLLSRAAHSLQRMARKVVGAPRSQPAGSMSGRSEDATALFKGVPAFAAGEAVLFDSTRKKDASKVPDAAILDRLELRFPDGAPDPDSLDAGLCLLIFVGDLASPRARVRLADVIRQRGQRPLNLAKQPGQVVRIVLADPAGAWAKAAPRLEVALGWSATS
jgi:Ca-activated chloride channel family protein